MARKVKSTPRDTRRTWLPMPAGSRWGYLRISLCLPLPSFCLPSRHSKNVLIIFPSPLLLASPLPSPSSPLLFSPLPSPPLPTLKKCRNNTPLPSRPSFAPFSRPYPVYNVFGLNRLARLDVLPAHSSRTKGGSFIWPGVEVGHTQTVTGLQKLESIEMKTLSMEPLV